MEKELEDLTSRVAMTPEQMEGLIGFIELNPALAKGKTKPQKLAQQLWTQCANKLNGYKDGAKKNGKQWAKSWTDIKYRVRRRAMEMQATNFEGKSVSEDMLPLSEMEERILSVIGTDFIEQVVITCDDATWNTELHDMATTGGNMGGNNSLPSRSDGDNDPEDKLPPKKATNRSKTSVQELKARKRASQEAPDVVTPPKRRLRISSLNENDEIETQHDSEMEDHPSLAGGGSAAEFLEMEKRKIETSERLTNAVCDIRDQIKHLVEVFTEIKDAFISARHS